jgi:phosphonate transport system ATP-binding protein
MLIYQNVSKRFGANAAVDNVNISVDSGTMLGIIGRSGAGKSTLLRLTNRLIDPSEGSIRFGPRDISGLKGKALLDWRADCAMIFQQFNLIPRLDVLTNVMLGRANSMGLLKSVFKLFTDAERHAALMALERLGIVETALQQAGTLSGGQQQRVAIARALMQNPKIILADEPIASLDPMNAKLVMDALRDINRQEGMTVVCNLHTLDTARTYCDRIVGMRAGKVVFDGTPAELTTDAAREIYGAGAEFDEAATSTSINDRPDDTGSQDSDSPRLRAVGSAVASAGG